jgi:hypothetical protein
MRILLFFCLVFLALNDTPLKVSSKTLEDGKTIIDPRDQPFTTCQDTTISVCVEELVNSTLGVTRKVEQELMSSAVG